MVSPSLVPCHTQLTSKVSHFQALHFFMCNIHTRRWISTYWENYLVWLRHGCQTCSIIWCGWFCWFGVVQFFLFCIFSWIWLYNWYHNHFKYHTTELFDQAWSLSNILFQVKNLLIISQTADIKTDMQMPSYQLFHYTCTSYQNRFTLPMIN